MELQKRFAAGDLEAFETLFRQFQAEVYRWIVRIVRDRDIAEDLTVETFWKIYRAHGRFDADGNFGAWARRIATNTALDHLKKNRAEVPLPEDLPAPAAHDSAVQRAIGAGIACAFEQLPARYRLAAILALIEEEPYTEIAQALGISVGAVKTRVFRAVRLLRKKLTRMGMAP